VPLAGDLGSWRSVRMNPSGSSSTLLRSQAVSGRAPMKQNRPVQGIVWSSPVAVRRSVTCSRRDWPANPWTSTPPSRTGDTPGEEAALTGEKGQLTDKRPRLICDKGLIRAFGSHDLDLALEDDEQVGGCLSRLEQQLSRRDWPLSSELGHFRELGGAQPGIGGISTAGCVHRRSPKSLMSSHVTCDESG